MLVEEREDRRLKGAFAHFVRDTAFPCVGAKSALSRGTLKTVVCSSIESGWDDLRIHRKLLDWAGDYRRDPGLFRSIAFIFAGPDDLSEHQFETAMWQRIQSLADKEPGWASPMTSASAAIPTIRIFP